VDLGLSDEQLLLQQTARRFIDTNYPIERIRELAESSQRRDGSYHKESAQLGWTSMLVDEREDSQSVLNAAVLAAERGRLLQPGAFVPGNVVAWALATVGNEFQQQQVLPTLISGDSVGTWAAGDPDGRWEAGIGAHLDTSRDPYLLTGAKGLVQDADLAEWLLVTAQVEGGGVTQVLVHSNTPGIQIVPLEGLDITRHFSRIHFNDVQVVASDIVGGLGQAGPAIEKELQFAVVLTLGESVGAMERDLEMAVEYAKARHAFGRPIGSFQAIKHLLADTSLLLETSKAAVTAAIEAVQGETDDSGEIASMAKAYVGDCSTELAQNCFQVFGGIGHTWEHNQHLYLRRLMTDCSLFGQPAWHRERIWDLNGL
jgi:alkylation response protein AidB-like acyl-CoA dehydrogenase